MSKTSGRNGRQSPSMLDSSTSSSIIRCDTASSSTGFNIDEPARTPCNNGMKNRCRYGNILDEETRGLIEEFVTRDDNSRITTGKNQTLNKNKIKKNRNACCSTVLTNLHKKFGQNILTFHNYFHPVQCVLYATTNGKRSGHMPL